ncbi:putative metallo-beta-lactamase, partial [Porphyromonas gingivalis]
PTSTIAYERTSNPFLD